MKVKLQLSEPQRNELARIFNRQVREHMVYHRMGASLKALMGDSIRLYFVPFKSAHTPLPPIEVEHKQEKDEDGNVVEDKYEFTLDLVVPFIKGVEINLKETISKAGLDNIV